ncbi:hypothetical protein [uncultured Cardiobacterium sp.]|uniref:hypothetical protein n=1 Tax=uncultured Cardiobacterium sp. TaxID=417619 RepID=UPI0026314A4B|nr:hypothetical protein [uncultured Cardiobacterium sp.]
MNDLINLKKNDAGDAAEQEEYARIIDLDINVIETSHMNPRQTRGEHYESTKESIRNIGLLQMLTVTKVPEQEHFSLYNGGNTRLSILKELYQEYLAAGEDDKAEAIRFQQCRYVPYTDVCETGLQGSEKNISDQEKVSQNPCHNQRLKTCLF